VRYAFGDVSSYRRADNVIARAQTVIDGLASTVVVITDIVSAKSACARARANKCAAIDLAARIASLSAILAPLVTAAFESPCSSTRQSPAIANRKSINLKINAMQLHQNCSSTSLRRNGVPTRVGTFRAISPYNPARQGCNKCYGKHRRRAF